MPKQVVYSVHQRSAVDPAVERELGMFTDDMMADQAIDHLYRYAWQDIVQNVFSAWYDPTQREDIRVKGFDFWMVDDKNSALPMFFKRPHELWNQVPPSAEAFNFREAIVDLGVVPVEEVKKLF